MIYNQDSVTFDLKVKTRLRKGQKINPTYQGEEREQGRKP